MTIWEQVQVEIGKILQAEDAGYIAASRQVLLHVHTIAAAKGDPELDVDGPITRYIFPGGTRVVLERSAIHRGSWKPIRKGEAGYYGVEPTDAALKQALGGEAETVQFRDRPEAKPEPILCAWCDREVSPRDTTEVREGRVYHSSCARDKARREAPEEPREPEPEPEPTVMEERTCSRCRLHQVQPAEQWPVRCTDCGLPWAVPRGLYREELEQYGLAAIPGTDPCECGHTAATHVPRARILPPVQVGDLTYPCAWPIEDSEDNVRNCTCKDYRPQGGVPPAQPTGTTSAENRDCQAERGDSPGGLVVPLDPERVRAGEVQAKEGKVIPMGEAEKRAFCRAEEVNYTHRCPVCGERYVEPRLMLCEQCGEAHLEDYTAPLPITGTCCACRERPATRVEDGDVFCGECVRVCEACGEWPAVGYFNALAKDPTAPCRVCHECTYDPQVRLRRKTFTLFPGAK